MEIGSFLLLQSISENEPRDRFNFGIRYCHHTEQLGFHSIWLGEHHFSKYSPLSRPLLFASYIAARTSKIRIGTAAALSPLQHPLILAEEFATLDILSHGRMEIGLSISVENYVTDRLGSGYSFIQEKWEEQVEILSKALIDPSINFKGKFYSIQNTRLNPRSIQKPSPPLWIVANNERSLKLAQFNDFGVLIRGVFKHPDCEGRPRDLEAFIDKFKPSGRKCIQAIIYVADTKKDAADATNLARKAIAHTLNLRSKRNELNNQDREHDVIDLVVKTHAIIGTIEEVIEKISSCHREIKFSHLIANFCFADMEEERVFKSMEKFAKFVMPVIKSL